MTLTLDLPSEVEACLRERAEERGLDASEYALSLLKEAMEGKGEKGEPLPANGAELVALLRKDGVIGAWADRTDIGDSVEFARELRRQAETRGTN